MGWILEGLLQGRRTKAGPAVTNASSAARVPLAALPVGAAEGREMTTPESVPALGGKDRRHAYGVSAQNTVHRLNP